MNISQISNKESNFNIDNLTNYLIFTCDKNKTINSTNQISFTLEGKTNHELTKDINLILSFNNTNGFKMNCVISKNGSRLNCSFNKSNLKVDNYTNIYSIKENEISSNDENIFLIGLNKVGFIYEKGEVEINENINKKGLKLFIIIIIIITIILIIYKRFKI